jgi:hypothetical protein
MTSDIIDSRSIPQRHVTRGHILDMTVDNGPEPRYRSGQKGRSPNESVLCEVPGKQGYKESQSRRHEEQEAGDPGHLPNLLNEGLQNRQGLALDRTDFAAARTVDYPCHRDTHPLCCCPDSVFC